MFQANFVIAIFFSSLLFLMLLRRPEWKQNLFEIPKLNFNLASILLFFKLSVMENWKKNDWNNNFHALAGREKISLFALLQISDKLPFCHISKQNKKTEEKKHKSTHISFHSNPVSSKFVISQLWVVIYLKFKQGILLEKF